MATDLTKANIRSAFSRDRAKTQGEISKLEEEVRILQEEYDAPTPDYTESQDLQLMRDLAVAARDEMQAPVISNIAAQLAMVRNPAFERQWQDVTRRRINAAREYFQRQGLVARQAATEEEAFRRYNKRDPRRLLEAKRSLEKARRRLSESPVEEAKVMTGLRKAEIGARSREGIAEMRQKAIDLDARILDLNRSTQNIQRITKTTGAENQAQMISALMPQFAQPNMANESVRKEVLRQLREYLKEQQMDLAVLRRMKKFNKGPFVKDVDTYNALETRARRILGRGRPRGGGQQPSTPQQGQQTGGRQETDRRAKFR